MGMRRVTLSAWLMATQGDESKKLPEGEIVSVRIEREDGILVLTGDGAKQWDEIVRGQGALAWVHGSPTPPLPWEVEPRTGHVDVYRAGLELGRAQERKACIEWLEDHAKSHEHGGEIGEARVLREKAQQFKRGDHRR